MPAQHILLVEDDPDLLSLLTEVLEGEGYRVTGASGRQQARAALRKGDVDLLIADSVLRGGNGDDVAKAAGRRGMSLRSPNIWRGASKKPVTARDPQAGLQAAIGSSSMPAT